MAGGRIVAVGSRDAMRRLVGPGTDTRDVGGCVLPGFVEAHGHPLMEAIVLSERMVDIRPVTLPDRGRRRRARRRGGYLNGWDPLLESGSPSQRRAVRPRRQW